MVDGVKTCDCTIEYAGERCEKCSAGYQDNDRNGVCERRCEYSGMNCIVNAYCSDKTGTAICHCRTGHQDVDGDLKCYPTCEKWLAPESEEGSGQYCSPEQDSNRDPGLPEYNGPTHGSCVINPEIGKAECACAKNENGEAIYIGEHCESCATGYQDEDGDGVCKPDCSGWGKTCENQGQCKIDLETGDPYCDCAGFWAGETCTECADGYQDDDGDGQCEPDCSHVSCGLNAACQVLAGEAVCRCNEHHQDLDGDGDCHPECASDAWHCSEGGTCHYYPEGDLLQGQPFCDCPAESAGGPHCEGCGADFLQDNDNDGECEATCAASTNMGLNCGGIDDLGRPRGECSDEDGTATCVCSSENGYSDEGYVAASGDPHCRSCAAGYQDNDGDGTCREDCSSFDCTSLYGENSGPCDDSSGVPVCDCLSGYVLVDERCEPTCAATGVDAIACSADKHLVCDDNSGTQKAQCVCAGGYQNNDNKSDISGDPVCQENCATYTAQTLGKTCAEATQDANRVCSDSDGSAGCDGCQGGYALKDGGDPTCVAKACVDYDDCGQTDDEGNELDPRRGHCDAVGGLAQCICEPGWGGDFCDSPTGGSCDDVAEFELPRAGQSIVLTGEATGNSSSSQGVGNFTQPSGDAEECDQWQEAQASGDYNSNYDIVYEFVVPDGDSVDVTFRSMGEDADLLLYLRKGDCTGGVQVACHDSLEDWNLPQRAVLDTTLEPGIYWFFVDNMGEYNTDVGPTFTYSIEVKAD